MRAIGQLTLVVLLTVGGPLPRIEAAAPQGARGPAVGGVASAEAVSIPAGTTVAIDGTFDEDIWSRAPLITGFVVRDPHEGATPSHPTDARVLFDGTALYVAVRAADPDPHKIVGLLTRRDDFSPSDRVSVLVDSFRDRRTAFEFGVNASGVKHDLYWFNDSNNDRGWDAVWDVAITRDAEGWRAEFRIPFSQLRFNPGATDGFGFAIVRSVAHASETSTWPLLARSASGYVSSFGELRGLALPQSQKKLELMPYAVTQVTTAPVPAGSPLAKSPDPGGALGLDLKYKIAPGLSFTGTINPDFGQVEADPAVVNLGAFETFFAERRPFFVEGSGNFSFDIDCNDGACTGLFYSRRIGRAPRRMVSAPAGGFAAQPANSTIFGATKLTGRIGKFSVGAIHAITSREDAQVVASAGVATSRTAVEPATSYSVGRASREFANRSRVGFLMTSTNRRLPDELRTIAGSAITGGVDGDWRLRGGRYSLSGYWAGSSVRGTAESIDLLQRSNVHSFQRPDATHLSYDPTRRSLLGHAGAVNFGKISGQRTRFSSNLAFKSPGFDINDVGFLSRADEVTQSHWVQLRRDTPGKYIRNVRVNLNQWAGWNVGGDRRYTGVNVNAHAVLVSNWSLGGGVNVNTRGFSDRLTRGGPGGYVNGSLSQWSYLNTDDRKAVQGYVNVSSFSDRAGSRGWNVSPGLTWRPQSALSVSGGLGYNRNVNDTQWVTNLTSAGAPHYVFGRIDQTTVSVSLRANYTMTPTLSLQLYAAPFVSAGDYGSFKELVDGRAASYGARYAPYAYGGNPDFNFHSLRMTNVLRWEYRPGSALFVVWQQGRELVTSQADFRFGRDFGDAFGAPATNMFLVKISRWLNF
jgi:Domain of unknown function (DUF5916)/Carbohydrate family 9 binding domain-like